MKYRDEIHTETRCEFGLLDRLRIFIKGVAVIDVRTKTEHLPGNCESRSRAYAPKLFRLKKRPGMIEVKKSNKVIQPDPKETGG